MQKQSPVNLMSQGSVYSKDTYTRGQSQDLRDSDDCQQIIKLVDRFQEKDLQELKMSLRSGHQMMNYPKPGRIELNNQKIKLKTVAASIKINEMYVKKLFFDKFPQMDAERQLRLLNDLDDLERGKQHLKEMLMRERSARQMLVVPTVSKRKWHTLKFDILSTHGSRAECGLTEIDVFERNNRQITESMSVRVCGSPFPNQHQVHRLSDSYTHTNDPDHMWFCNLPLLSEEHVSIELTFQAQDRIGFIRVWNYNKTVIDAKMGVKQTNVYLDGSLIYQGSIRQGTGSPIADYSHYIPVQYEDEPDIKLIRPTQQDAIEMIRGGFSVNARKPTSQIEVSGSFSRISQVTEPNRVQRMSLNIESKNDQVIDSHLVNKRSVKNHPKVLNIFDKSIDTNVRQISNTKRDTQLVPTPKILRKPRILNDDGDRSTLITQQSNFIKTPTPQIEIIDRRLINNLLHQRKSSVKKIASIGTQLMHKFIIPQRPTGRYLKLTILNNHGDMKYVGMSGIDVFDYNGSNISKYIRVLRVKGVDGQILLDKFKDFLDPLKGEQFLVQNQKFDIELDLGINRGISLIRIWNYSKSRMYVDRGIKRLLLTLDDQNLGILDIRRASGSHTNLIENQETILFTTDSRILQLVAQNDWLLRNEDDQLSINNFHTERPFTGQGVRTQDNRQEQYSDSPKKLAQFNDQRITKKKQYFNNYFNNQKPIMSGQFQHNHPPPQGSTITLHLLSTYGDPHYIGLDGFEIYDHNGQPLLSTQTVRFRIYGLPELPNDTRSATNLTRLPHGQMNSFLSTLNASQPNKVIVKFEQPIATHFMEFWNYTKEPKRGVSEVQVLVDGRIVSQVYYKHFIISKANLNISTATKIYFSDPGRALNCYQETEQAVLYYDEGQQLFEYDYQPPLQHKYD